MDELENVNVEQAFNNVRNGTWDLETFREWCSDQEVEARNDAAYYCAIHN